MARVQLPDLKHPVQATSNRSTVRSCYHRSNCYSWQRWVDRHPTDYRESYNYDISRLRSTTIAKTVADKQGAFSYLKPSNIAKNLGIGGGPSTPAGITSVGGGATDPSFLSKVGEGFTKSIVEDPIGKGTQLVGTGLITAGLLTGEEEEGDGRNLVDYEPYEAEGGVFEGLGYNPETGRFENVRVIRPTDFERAAAGGEISGPGTGTRTASQPCFLTVSS